METINNTLARPVRQHVLRDLTNIILFIALVAITTAAFLMGNKSLDVVVLGILIATSVSFFLCALLTHKINNSDRGDKGAATNETAEEAGAGTRSLKLHHASPLHPQRTTKFHIMGDRKFIVVAEFPDTQAGHSAAAEYLESRYGRAVLDKARGAILIGYEMDMGIPVVEGTDSYNESSEDMGLIGPESKGGPEHGQ